MKGLSAKWPQASRKMVEDKANGPAVISLLKHEISGIVPISPGQDSKLTRALAAAPEVEAGNVYLPKPKYAPWVHDLISELCDFPSGKHDDQVDALTYALNYFRNSGRRVVPPKVPAKVVRIGGGWS